MAGADARQRNDLLLGSSGEVEGEQAPGIVPLLSPLGWLILIVGLAAAGLALRERQLLVMVSILVVGIGLAWIWGRRALHGVRYQRIFGERRIFPGETVRVATHTSNGKLLPLTWLLTYDTWPRGVDLLEGGTLLSLPGWGSSILLNASSLRGYERSTRRYVLRCSHRGVYSFGPVTLRSGDLFGLFRQERAGESQDRLIVYPRLFSLEEMGLPPKEPLGEIRTAGWLFQDPSRTVGVRDYRIGDGFRHVHWKASARRQELQTRVYEPTTTLSLVVFLNVATDVDYWRGSDADLLEWAVSVAGSMARYGIERQMAVGLVSNGAVYRSDQPLRVLPGRSADQLMWILEGLAGVSGYATRPIESMMLSESPRLRWGATLVVITAVLTEPLRAALARLREAGRKLAVVTLGGEPPPPLEGVTTIHMAVPPPGMVSPDAPRPARRVV